MRLRIVNTTKEQGKFRAAILKKKIPIERPEKERIKKQRVVEMPKQTSRETYMQNCLYWIKEYAEGRAGKEEAKKAVFYLRKYCDEIIAELS